MRWPKEPSRWDEIAKLFRRKLDGLLVVSATCVAGLCGFALFGFVLPKPYLTPYLWFAWLPAAAAAIFAFWYMAFRRDTVREPGLRQEILDLANSPAKDLHFTNGETGSFSPKGSIWMASGVVALGFDPAHQLIRFVSFGVAGTEGIHMDWIHGTEGHGALEVAEVPVPGLANRLRKLVGLSLAKATILRPENIDGRNFSTPIHPDHIAKARDLVHQMNFSRPETTSSTL